MDDDFKAGVAVIAVNIERELFKKYSFDGQYIQKGYFDKARSLIFNLKDPKNPDLRFKLICSELKAEAIVAKDSKELASDLKKAERDKTQQDNLNARRTDYNMERLKENGGKGFFTCKKCRSQNTMYVQMQTRGADEPMTNFITCLDCKTQWKS